MKKSIELLNKAAAEELNAVLQYLSFYFYCDDQGYYLLANLFKKTANDKMKHVEKLAKRILFLKGEVDMMSLQKVKKVKNLKDMLVIGRKMEKEIIKKYQKYGNECLVISDPVSKQLFDNLLTDEKRNNDRFEAAIGNIEKIEADNYLATY